MALLDEHSDYGLWQRLSNNFDVDVATYANPSLPIRIDQRKIKDEISNLHIEEIGTGDITLRSIVTTYINEDLIPQLPKTFSSSGMRIGWKIKETTLDNEGLKICIADVVGFIWIKIIIVPMEI